MAVDFLPFPANLARKPATMEMRGNRLLARWRRAPVVNFRVGHETNACPKDTDVFAE